MQIQQHTLNFSTALNFIFNEFWFMWWLLKFKNQTRVFFFAYISEKKCTYRLESSLCADGVQDHGIADDGEQTQQVHSDAHGDGERELERRILRATVTGPETVVPSGRVAADRERAIDPIDTRVKSPRRVHRRLSSSHIRNTYFLTKKAKVFLKK